MVLINYCLQTKLQNQYHLLCRGILWKNECRVRGLESFIWKFHRRISRPWSIRLVNISFSSEPQQSKLSVQCCVRTRKSSVHCCYSEQSICISIVTGHFAIEFFLGSLSSFASEYIVHLKSHSRQGFVSDPCFPHPKLNSSLLFYRFKSD